MKRFVAILIGFLHDFAAGCWAATLLATYWLGRISLKTQGLQSELADIKKDFFYIGLGCAAIVLLAGIGRSFSYVANVCGENNEKLRKRMLVIKHIILFLIFGIGTYWQYRMVYW